MSQHNINGSTIFKEVSYQFIIIYWLKRQSIVLITENWDKIFLLHFQI